MPKVDDQLRAMTLKDFHFNENGTITLGDDDIAHIKAIFILLQHFHDIDVPAV